MRSFDFSPLFRTTVGFDRLLDGLDDTVHTDWPLYNIEKKADDEYRISMAVAGFGPDEIELVQQGNTLLITGQKKTQRDQGQVLHQGIAFRNFRQSFRLADHVKVVAAKLENGLLSISLVRELPEQLKPRRIEIASTTEALPVQDNRPKQIDQSSQRTAKAA